MQPTADWHWPTNWVQNAERPCEIHNRPAREGESYRADDCDSQFVWYWHMLPEAWQLQLYGEVVDEVGFWTCPNEWNRFRVALIGTPGDDISAHLATTAQSLWEEALRQKAERIASRPQSVDLSKARCDQCGGGMMLYMGKFLHDCGAVDAGPTEVPARETLAGSARGSRLAPTAAEAASWAPAPLRPIEVRTDQIPVTETISRVQYEDASPTDVIHFELEPTSEEER